MKKSAKRRRKGEKNKERRIERLATRIEAHLTALDEDSDELDAAITETDHLGYTRREEEALGASYTMTPIRMLLLATRIIIDGMPDESGFDRNRIVEMARRWKTTQPAPSRMASESLDLLRECVDYLEEFTPDRPDDNPAVPLVH
ncbi:MAG: hypothetical protein F4137_22560 [Acidobacteria bacterium]|nr:hypothetical protein [Acidobacteriota bacterium]